MADNILKKYFPVDISKKQASDTGMAMTLILLLVGYFTQQVIYYKLAIPVLVLTMAAPMFFSITFIASIWLGLTTLLGEVVSKVLLSVIYFVILFPVSIIRQLMGKDTLDLKTFKKSNKSVMVTRDHLFVSKDIEHPY
ncbi:MAG TPA: SxtJ family membrane protein [Ferruginibacter sp.]|nr:SxtJ family membrane protein [Ferruginibacter sp.]